MRIFIHLDCLMTHSAMDQPSQTESAAAGGNNNKKVADQTNTHIHCYHRPAQFVWIVSHRLTMTEVKASPTGGLGLYATKKYAVGDTILEEHQPLVFLAPRTDDEEVQIRNALFPSSAATKTAEAAGKVSAAATAAGVAKSDNGAQEPNQPSLSELVVVPSGIDEKDGGKFRGMINAVLCWAELRQQQPKASSTKDELLQLYVPSLTEPSPQEASIVKLSKDALEYVQKTVGESSRAKSFVTDHPDDAQRIMLVWACNSFQGGRVYSEHSRVNHSCDPNGVIQADEDGQRIRAVADIAPGDEITISYLGVLQYTETRVRKQELAERKHFDCQCDRCVNRPDIAASIPCDACHPRDGRYLDEDVQFDDDQDVHYVVRRKPGEDFLHCDHCQHRMDVDSNELGSTSRVVRAASDRVLSYLHDRELSSSKNKGQNRKDNDDDEDDDEVVDGEWTNQLLQLSISVSGAKHWTTNLMLLEKLNRDLQQQHESMIETGKPPAMEDLAECIDALERIFRFVDGLGLQMHKGHLLSNVVIGVARSLVSLGDTKSKKYASEWIAKIQDYVSVFEAPGVQKVAEALAVAWKKRESNTRGLTNNGNAGKSKAKKQRRG